jgi:dolichol-phosphate mannosyltransferase
MRKYKTLSIIIPVYNEEKFIEETVKKVLKAPSLGLKKEIIIIDDGSKDRTKEKILKLSKK